MLFSLLFQNLITALLMALCGYPLAKFLRERGAAENSLQVLFLSLFLGFFLFETGVAIYFTQGKTLQWLNLFPLFYCCYQPKVRNLTEEKVSLASLAYSFGVLVLGSVYFLTSYAPDWCQFTRQPFIDLISYGSTAFSLGQSGIETAAFQRALFFPEQTGLGLYHFVELWFSVGIARIFSVSETYVIALILPVQLLVWISVGLLGHAKSSSSLIAFFLSLALPFANYKTLLGNDVFLYNFLDLTGLKIGLLWVSLMVLWQIRKNPALFLGICLLLPQENILYAMVTPFLFLGYLQVTNGSIRMFFNRPFLILLSALLVCGLSLLLTLGQKSGTHSLDVEAFSMGDWLLKTAVYFREGSFNLGILYWWPAFLLGGLFFDKRFHLPLAAFVLAKILGKGFVLASHLELVQPLVEAGGFLLFLYLTSRFTEWQLPPLAYRIFVILLGLATVGAFGNVATGHMDFEQIFSLFSCAVFPVFFAITLLSGDQENGWLSAYVPSGLNRLLLSAVFLVLSIMTFRWQRVEGFEAPFYQLVKSEMASSKGPHLSAYLSDRKLYPFPLHIQAGLPLLLEDGSAISTPIHIWDDSSWQGTEREGQVQELPFALFTQGVRPMDHSAIRKAQVSFLRRFQIRFLWMDPACKSSSLTDQIRPAIRREIRPKGNGPVFLVLDPGRLPK